MEDNNIKVEETKTVEGNEGTGDVDTQTTNKNEGNAENDIEAKAQKIADAMVAKKMKGMPSKEELKAFKEWQESQKTAEQKQAEKDAEYAQKDNTISQLQKEVAILKAGVKDTEDVDYILFKVSKMEGEFEENLAKFLNDNPKFTKGEELNEPKATGAPVKSISSTDNGVTAILKAKHPELFEK